ncbi:MAG: hypothetical protein HOJ02_02630 [Rhodospirillaceae bacterium]|nr:hypothetical protein [Rhodospirillaceae bacterium]
MSVRFSLFLFLFALGMRWISLAFLGSDEAMFMVEDVNMYWPASAEILSHGASALFTMDGGTLFITERVPGYPLFLAFLRIFFGDSYIPILALQGIIDSGTCVLIGFLGAMLSPHIGRLSAVLAALWPNLIIHSNFLLSEALFLHLFVWMLYFSAHFLKRPRPQFAGLSGLFLGASLTLRSVSQLATPVMLVLTFAVPLIQRKPLKTAVFSSIAFTLACAIPLSPLLTRNISAFDSAALSAQSGHHLLGWVVPLVRGIGDGTPHDTASRQTHEGYATYLAEENITPTDNPFRESTRMSEYALEELKKMPASWIARIWVQGAAINLAAPAILIDPRVRALPKPSFYDTPGAGFGARLWSFVEESSGAYFTILALGIAGAGLVLILQGVGFIRLVQLSPWAALFAGLMVLYFLGVTGPVTSPKYRLPLEPVLIILTALGLAAPFWARLWKDLRQRIENQKTS